MRLTNNKSFHKIKLRFFIGNHINLTLSLHVPTTTGKPLQIEHVIIKLDVRVETNKSKDNSLIHSFK